ncbi:MAG: hypothetical protein LBV06_07175 [Propionibacteriaceae bacterium]|jgi:hypothetical protein|nr:hypothetical protein [Propionibacteriaceae bacterium]
MSKRKHKHTVVQPAPVQPVNHVLRPQDHQHPAGDGPTRIRVHGLDLTVDGAALDDVELFDMLNEFGSDTATSMMLVPRMIRALFGTQTSQVMDQLRDPDTQRVTFESASEFLAEAMVALDPNSPRSPSSLAGTAGR